MCHKPHDEVPEPPRRDLALLAPIMPRATGNGLAMRVGAQLQALSELYRVRLVVVPVAGGSLDAGWAERSAASVHVVVPADEAGIRAGSARLVADGAWRERLQRAQPFPPAVTYASPALASAVVSAVDGMQGARVHAVRAYLAPLAVAVAEQLSAPWSTLDLDDDDEHLLDRQSDRNEARAYGRILATFGEEFAWLSLAAPEDAARVASRHGLRTVVIPNSVSLPAIPVGGSRRSGGPRSLLLVGNLTYAPNVEAAQRLVVKILPRVRALVGEAVTVELAGAFDPAGPVPALAAHDGVVVRGYVDDLDDCYARADLVVVPLSRGTGTRIKLLEAFAAGVPVVTTPTGAAGLGTEHGTHLLIAEGPRALAAAVARLLTDDALAAGLASAGRSFVAERFSPAIVGRQLAALTAALDSPDEPALHEV
jgi:glycosyltransferase involved in cell wall biosynthesis